jgi:hypothetical protein
MSIIALVIFIVILIVLIPRIRNWYIHHHCPRCHSWFTLHLDHFDVEHTIDGHDKNGMNGGALPALRNGGFPLGLLTRSRDRPFLKEFGKGRYLCSKCGLHYTIEESRERR